MFTVSTVDTLGDADESQCPGSTSAHVGTAVLIPDEGTARMFPGIADRMSVCSNSCVSTAQAIRLILESLVGH